MAYSQQELESYWSDVNNGAAPNNFEGSDTFSESQTSDLGDIRSTSVMDRQSAMDFAEGYRTEPGEAQMLSQRLSGVLESDSPYIERARTKAKEAAGARGLLSSSMAAGAAEGAAIDRGLDVARGDVDVDKFNVGAQTDAEELRYQAAQEIGGMTQDFQNQLGGAESEYLFDVGLTEEKQEDALETQQRDYEIKQTLQDSAHAQQMDTDMLQYTNERAMEMLKQQSGLYAAYLESYGLIAGALDISEESKNDKLIKLGQQIDNAVIATEAYKDIEITGGGVTNFGITGLGDTTPDVATDIVDPTTGNTLTDTEVDELRQLLVDQNPDKPEPTQQDLIDALKSGALFSMTL